MSSDTVHEVRYGGISNPSGAVALDGSHFIVADDEDNKLRIYHRFLGGKALQTIALSSVFKGVIADGEDLEIDIESAAEIAGTVFWLGSHSTSKKGEQRPARQRLLAVTIKPGATGKYTVKAVGDIYTALIDDLCRDARFDRYRFDHARKTQAKAIGGLSIEGLAATAEHDLLIGFRNPLSGGEIKNDRLKNGKALLVRLKNPFEVIHGLPAKFADPVELDLGGFGIREIVRFKRNKYLIVAGPYHDNLPDGDHEAEAGRLYEWSIKSGKLNLLKRFNLAGFNIEAAVFYPGEDDAVQLLSDDGKLGQGLGFRSITIGL